METEKIDIIFSLPGRRNSNLYAWGSILNEGEKVFFSTITSNELWEIDLNDGSGKSYIFDEMQTGGAGVCECNGMIWIVPRKADKILCWNKERRILKVLNDFPVGYECGDQSFFKIYANERSVYLLPRDANMLLYINQYERILQVETETEKEICKNNSFDRFMRYSSIWRSGEYIYLFSARKGRLYVIKDNVVVNEEKIIIEKQSRMFALQEFEMENMLYSLESFIVYTQGGK